MNDIKILVTMTYWYCYSVWLYPYASVFVMHVLETHFCKHSYLPHHLRADTSPATVSDKNTSTPDKSFEVQYYINQQGRPSFKNIQNVL